MIELKPLSSGAIPGALAKAERYRLLNEPWQAESICHDVLAIDPDNHEALVTLLLALTDQFEHSSSALGTARALVPSLSELYDRAYYAGIIAERRAMALLRENGHGTGFMAYDWIREAMNWYEEAERLRPPGNDDAILRWNTCARFLMRHPHLEPKWEERTEPIVLE